MCTSNEMSANEPSLFTNKKKIRKKLWQLHINFHCSIIGTCLTLEELRFIAKKHLPAATSTTSDHELHSAFVCLAKAPDDVIRHCQKRLDKKYSAIIKQCARFKTDSCLLSLWKLALTSGNIAGTYWAIVTHPHSSESLLEQVFGEVHMLSHLSGASTRTDIKLLGKLRHEKTLAETSLSQNTDTFNKRLNKKQNEIDRLKIIQNKFEQDSVEIDQLTKRIHDLETCRKYQQLQKTIEGLSERLYTTTSQLGSFKRKYLELEIQLKNEQKRTAFLEQEAADSLKERDMAEVVLQKLLSSNCQQNCGVSNKQSCPINNLEGKNILYVGGRASQCPYFKTLVEQSNGSFLYHDGGKEDGRLKLNGALSQADVIVCPTDYISHDAYKRIKRHCDRQSKQLVMIAHASLSSFTSGLNEISTIDLHTL